VPAETFTGVTVARILRPRGLRGEVSAQILTDFPERLPKLAEVWLADGRPDRHDAPRRIVVRQCRLTTAQGGRAIFLFAGVESIEEAERLRGCEVQIPMENRAKLGPGSYYVDDLIGCAVWEAGASESLGVVRDVEFPGGVPLLAVDTAEGEVLVPLAEEFCVRVNVQAKRIDVTLPEGLRELNRG
jgi:16S rRNA processing protein RimM